MENHDHKINDNATAQAQLQQFYLDHLARAYCAYSHLCERLSELAGNELFEAFQEALQELILRAQKQLAVIENVYALVGKPAPEFSGCQGLTRFLEENFSAVQNPDTSSALRKHCLLSYLQYSNGILLSSFQVLHSAGEAIFDPRTHNLTSQLYDLARGENSVAGVLLN